MRSVCFIRHAESLGNIGETTNTPSQIALTPLGRAQAEALAATFPARPDLIVVSPFDRARETAEPLLKRFPEAATYTAEIQEFTYLSVEKCRNTNSVQRKPWVDDYWNRSDPNYCDGGDAESFSQFLARLASFIDDFLTREFSLAAVVTHEQVIKAIMWTRLAFASERNSDFMASFHKFMTSFKIPNTAIVRCLIEENGEVIFGRIIRR